jgi:alanine-synthesizing transaminase
MFSSRIPHDLAENALARATRQRRDSGLEVLDLTLSNPTTAGFSYPEELLGALTHPDGLLYQPDPSGAPSARAAIARYYQGRQLAVDPDRLVLTASTSEGYSWLFKLLCQPGEQVLVPRPSYPLFEHLASLEGVGLRPYALGFEDGWRIDPRLVEQALDEAGPPVRALVLVNPNNPTGSFVHRQDLGPLRALARRHDLALIVDEVFADYLLVPSPDYLTSLVAETEVLSFSLSGLSKVIGLPQLKLGWIHVAGPPGIVAEARDRLEFVADTYLSPSTPVMLATPRLLELGAAVRQEISLRTQGNLARLRGQVEGTPVSLIPVEGGWYGMLRLPRHHSDEQWALGLLEEEGVLTQPGYFYDCPVESCLVVSLLPSPTTFATGLSRLVALVRRR